MNDQMQHLCLQTLRQVLTRTNSIYTKTRLFVCLCPPHLFCVPAPRRMVGCPLQKNTIWKRLHESYGLLLIQCRAEAWARWSRLLWFSSQSPVNLLRKKPSNRTGVELRAEERALVMDMKVTAVLGFP